MKKFQFFNYTVYLRTSVYPDLHFRYKWLKVTQMDLLLNSYWINTQESRSSRNIKSSGIFSVCRLHLTFPGHLCSDELNLASKLHFLQMFSCLHLIYSQADRRQRRYLSAAPRSRLLSCSILRSSSRTLRLMNSWKNKEGPTLLTSLWQTPS